MKMPNLIKFSKKMGQAALNLIALAYIPASFPYPALALDLDEPATDPTINLFDAISIYFGEATTLVYGLGAFAAFMFTMSQLRLGLIALSMIGALALFPDFFPTCLATLRFFAAAFFGPSASSI